MVAFWSLAVIIDCHLQRASFSMCSSFGSIFQIEAIAENPWKNQQRGGARHTAQGARNIGYAGDQRERPTDPEEGYPRWMHFLCHCPLSMLLTDKGLCTGVTAGRGSQVFEAALSPIFHICLAVQRRALP